MRHYPPINSGYTKRIMVFGDSNSFGSGNGKKSWPKLFEDRTPILEIKTDIESDMVHLNDLGRQKVAETALTHLQ